jgi:hypothetical protein
MIYLINFYTLIIRLLHPDFRQEKMVQWLWSLIKPISQLHSAPSVVHPIRFPNTLIFSSPSFLSFRNYALLKTSLNGQTIVLERLLNLYYYSYFDPSQNKGTPGYWIYITDYTYNISYPFIYLDAENNTLPVYSQQDFLPPPPLLPNASTLLAAPQYIYSLQNYYSPIDFIIHVPIVLPTNLIEFQTLLDQYKLAATKFTIIYY